MHEQWSDWRHLKGQTSPQRTLGFGVNISCWEFTTSQQHVKLCSQKKSSSTLCFTFQNSSSQIPPKRGFLHDGRWGLENSWRSRQRPAALHIHKLDHGESISSLFLQLRRQEDDAAGVSCWSRRTAPTWGQTSDTPEHQPHWSSTAQITFLQNDIMTDEPHLDTDLQCTGQEVTQ